MNQKNTLADKLAQSVQKAKQSNQPETPVEVEPVVVSKPTEIAKETDTPEPEQHYFSSRRVWPD